MHRPLILALLFAVLAALRISSPTDLMEGDQERQVGYVMDILLNGDWLVQYEIHDQIASKPPFYNWCAAILCILFDSRAEWVMKLPSLLAGAGMLACVYLLARRFFDEKAAFYAGIACIASHHFSKLFWFARTDMLLACLLYLAIWLLVSLNSSWWKSLVLGLVVTAAALTKGPNGPVLFVIFFLCWSWSEGTLTERRAWRLRLPGIILFAVLVGGWLAAVWHVPQFQDQVLKVQLVERMTEASRARPFYYYFGHLFTRIAPWTAVAGLGVVLARRRPEWPMVRLTLLWGGLFFLYFSLIPVKRHDHLLPVYPAVFLLAGLGLRYVFEPVVSRAAGWVIYPVALGMVVVPVLPLTNWLHEPAMQALVYGVCACGCAALVCFWRGRRIALPIAALGLILGHGVYHHWAQPQGRAEYMEIVAFAERVRQQTGGGDDLLVFHTHPLIAYELGQHDRVATVEQLAGREVKWLIAPYYYANLIRQATRWQLTEKEAVLLNPREHQATLYRVEAPRRL